MSMGDPKPGPNQPVALTELDMYNAESIIVPGGVVAYITTENQRGKKNQDAIFSVRTRAGLWLVVVDGLGGYYETPTAVRLFLEELKAFAAQSEPGVDLKPVLREAHRRMNIQCPRIDFEIGSGGALVYSAVLISPKMEATMDALGDVRVIMTNLREAEDTPLASRDQHAGAAQNVVSICLAPWENLDTVLRKRQRESTSLRSGHLVLLCSDGVSGVFSDEQIIQTIKQNLEAGVTLAQAIEILQTNARLLTTDDITIVAYLVD